MSPKITIITVVYNDEQNISKTIESVINQSYDNIEFVIIDGGSTDSTLEEINKYINKINVFVSENDLGIYDAMNKGIRVSSGEWLLFLNSGDFFHRNNTLNMISDYIKQSGKSDIIYGDCNVLSEEINFNFIKKASNITNIKREMIFSHQACFIKRELHNKYNYNIKYKICADYDFLLKSYINGAKFYKIPELITTVTNGGLSDMNRIKVFTERLKIKNTLAPSFKNYFYFFKSVSYFFLMKIVKTLMPSSIFLKLYRLKYKFKEKIIRKI